MSTVYPWFGNFVMTNAHVGGIEGKFDVFRVE